jgi:peptide/nickel transport system substrate-binding protein
VSLGGLGGLGGCTRQRVPQDELVVLIEQPPKNIDPRYTTTSYDFKLAYLCYARMVTVDNDTLRPQLELAEQVQILERLPGGGMRLEITLRPALFSDGTPVESADVQYTLEQLSDEKTGSAGMRRRFSESGLKLPLEIVDSRRFRMTLVQPSASYLTDLDFGIMKRGTAGRREPASPGGPGGLAASLSTTLGKDRDAALPIGAGPFVPLSEAGEVTRFRRNPHYFGGPPGVERLTVRVVRDANSRLLSLVGGSADLTQNTVSPLLFDAVQRWQGRLQLTTAPSALLNYLGMNNEDSRLRDVRVRRALAMAIDRERIVRTKLFGKATLATGLLAPLHWAYHKPAEPLRYDPEAARKLLDAAGYPDPDGPGPKMRFVLQYKTSTDALPVAIARVIAAQLAEVGIGIEVRPLEFHLFLSDVKKGNYQLYTLSSAEIAEPNLHRNFFHSSFIPSAKNLDAGLNRMRYRSPELDALLDEGAREMDPARRIGIYAKVQDLIAQELPLLPLWHPDNVVVSRKAVQGFRMWPSAQLSGLATVRKTE